MIIGTFIWRATAIPVANSYFTSSSQWNINAHVQKIGEANESKEDKRVWIVPTWPTPHKTCQLELFCTSRPDHDWICAEYVMASVARNT